MRRLVLLLMLVGCRYHFGLAGDDAGPGDDGGGDDAALDAGPSANLVFITTTGMVPGQIGGIAMADKVCNDRAKAQGLPGTYVAWLSSASSNARDRFPASARGWRRLDGLPFADTLADIGSNRWFYPIRQDETGATVQGWQVVTATTAGGTYIGDGDCGEYTSLSGTVDGSSQGNGAQYWTQSQGQFCSTGGLRLFCFGTTESLVLAEPVLPQSARLAFLSANAWIPSNGLAGADLQCQNEANAAGIGSRSFIALLATPSASAISRLNLNGPPWYRVDGVQLVASAADLPSHDLIAPLDVTAAKGYPNAGMFAWTGADLITNSGTATTTCQNWSSAQNTDGGNYSSISNYGPLSLSSSFTFACDATNGLLFCFEP